ncbi:hypothetical protein HALO59_80218 [Halomonas sp. 59]|nr:hypothetical protein HALO59_80218 [Halomonas sp. 59]
MGGVGGGEGRLERPNSEAGC